MPWNDDVVTAALNRIHLHLGVATLAAGQILNHPRSLRPSGVASWPDELSSQQALQSSHQLSILPLLFPVTDWGLGSNSLPDGLELLFLPPGPLSQRIHIHLLLATSATCNEGALVDAIVRYQHQLRC